MLKDTLYIFVEGPDDERLFDRVIVPILDKRFFIKKIRHARLSKSQINVLVRNIGKMGSDYVFVVDKDDSPTVENRKHKVTEKYTSLDQDKVFVVVKEIESWYLAGLSKQCCKGLRISHSANTENVDKEQFLRLMPHKKYDSRVDFMIEILKVFSVEVAAQQNNSFACFRQLYL